MRSQSTISRRLFSLAFIGVLVLGSIPCVFAGFGSTEIFLPAVGRVAGNGGSEFYTTVWVTNLGSSAVSFTFDFLKQGQANASPVSFTDTLPGGQTKMYENVVESMLGLTDAIGAARVVSSGPLFLAERIYNQEPGDDLGKTEGLFFSGVPRSFSISVGQSASIQGINQGGSENFRYNFALVETGGGSPTVDVQVFDGGGTLLGQKAYVLQPYEQIQPNVADIVPGIATTNARITASVTGGTGSVILAGAQLANESQDSSGFEMTFLDSLLAGNGGTAGVTSLNGLTGAVALTPGNGISIKPAGNSIAIAYTGGGSSGLTLPFAGSISGGSNVAFQVTNQGQYNEGIEGIEVAPSTIGPLPAGVVGSSSSKGGVFGASDSVAGVEGVSNTGAGVFGETGSAANSGVAGQNDSTSPGNGGGVTGASVAGFGVHAFSRGTGLAGAALRAEGNGIAAYETNNSGDSTLVLGNGNSGGYLIKGFGGGAGSPQFTVNSSGAVTALSFNGNSNDFADRLPSQDGLAPGEVVAIGKDGTLLRTTTANQIDVAGVYSTKPAMVAGLEKPGASQVPLAVAGVIPVRATAEGGPIRPGDLLVSSSTPGAAMRAPENPRPGTVIGKAMQALDSGSGTIEMLVMLR